MITRRAWAHEKYHGHVVCLEDRCIHGSDNPYLQRGMMPPYRVCTVGVVTSKRSRISDDDPGSEGWVWEEIDCVCYTPKESDDKA